MKSITFITEIAFVVACISFIATIAGALVMSDQGYPKVIIGACLIGGLLVSSIVGVLVDISSNLAKMVDNTKER